MRMHHLSTPYGFIYLIKFIIEQTYPICYISIWMSPLLI